MVANQAGHGRDRPRAFLIAATNFVPCLKPALPATGHSSWHADPQVLTIPKRIRDSAFHEKALGRISSSTTSQLTLQSDVARGIQNAVAARAIPQVLTDRELLTLANIASNCLHDANLLLCRSPFHCALSASVIGSVSHPEGDRPSHPIW